MSMHVGVNILQYQIQQLLISSSTSAYLCHLSIDLNLKVAILQDTMWQVLVGPSNPHRNAHNNEKLIIVEQISKIHAREVVRAWKNS